VEVVMRRLFWIAGGVVGVVVLSLVLLRIVGLRPGPIAPGLWLKGELVTTPINDWTFANDVRGLTQIESRHWFLPVLRHSVTIGRFVHKGELYVFSVYPAGVTLPAGRHWNRNIIRDPRVRIKIGDKLYDRKLVYITDPAQRMEILRARGPRYFDPGIYLQLWHAVPDDTSAAPRGTRGV
jgi:hypothetical protein